MALTLDVENTLDRVVGRAGHRFDPGESKEIRIESTRLFELQDCPYLNVTVKDADYLAEIPEGMSINFNATDDAVSFARSQGVDLFAVEGTGSGGRVTKRDVQEHVARAEAQAGPGEGVVSTLDSLEEQKRAEAESMRKLLSSEQRGLEHEVVAGEAIPDQTAEAEDTERHAGDVEVAEESGIAADEGHGGNAAKGR